jgi:hypothetical protein
MRHLRLVLAMVAVLALSYGLVAGWHQLLKLPSLNIGGGNRPHAARDAAGPYRAFAIGTTLTRHDLAGATRLSVDNPFGSVRLLPGGAQVAVKEAVYARGETRTKAEEEARKVRVEVFRDGDELALRVTGDRWNDRVGVDLAVSLPTGLPARVGTVEGDITVRGLRAALEARAISGSIDAAELGGHLSANTTSGDIRVEGAPEGIDVHTVSGEAALHSVSGDADVSSVSGGISLDALTSTRLDAHSTSGEIIISTKTPFSGHLSAHSISGDVTVTLPPGSDCDIHTSSVSGGVNGGIASRSGAVGLVEVKTVSGEITLRNGGTAAPG